jgi:hypothetical protein
VRLPRDWLGPRDELVPIGRVARSRPAEPESDVPPAADAFWSEDSAALHDAVQAPPAAAWAPIGPAEPSARRRVRLPLHGRRPVRTALVGAALVTAVALAVIGYTDKPGLSSARHASASTSAAASLGVIGAMDSLMQASSSSATRSAAHPTNRPAHRRAGPARPRAGDRRPRSKPVRHRGRAIRRVPSSPGPVTQPTTTSVAPPVQTTPVVSTPTPTPTTSAGPTHGSSQPTATSARHTAFGQNGTLGPGSSPDS